MDVAETEDDAVAMALRDQELAGIDLISDGEMRRQGFIVSIFKYFGGLKPLEPRRKVGVLSYDGHVLYEPVERISAPGGLGAVKELEYLRRATTRPFKITLPGPLTLATQVTRGGPYRDRFEIASDLAAIINRELKALAAGGARNLQLDDVYQSFLMEPKQLIELYDRCFDGVAVERRFWHICFGTLEGFGYGERTYRPLFPAICGVSADQLVFEFANRELAETTLWREFDCPKELGAGVIDLKNFYVESPELVARRIGRLLESVKAEKLWVNPDCGLARLPRHPAFAKLQALVAGAQKVRAERA
jgi:5-methyltetrahydropteroyltriglutamate--homocysteine methyltransferase